MGPGSAHWLHPRLVGLIRSQWFYAVYETKVILSVYYFPGDLNRQGQYFSVFKGCANSDLLFFKYLLNKK